MSAKIIWLTLLTITFLNTAGGARVRKTKVRGLQKIQNDRPQSQQPATDYDEYNAEYDEYYDIYDDKQSKYNKIKFTNIINVEFELCSLF